MDSLIRAAHPRPRWPGLPATRGRSRDGLRGHSARECRAAGRSRRSRSSSWPSEMRMKTMVAPDPQDPFRRRRRGQLARRLPRMASGGLFHQDVFSAVQRGERAVGDGVVRRRHDDGVEVRPGDQFLPRAMAFGPVLVRQGASSRGSLSATPMSRAPRIAWARLVPMSPAPTIPTRSNALASPSFHFIVGPRRPRPDASGRAALPPRSALEERDDVLRRRARLRRGSRCGGPASRSAGA